MCPSTYWLELQKRLGSGSRTCFTAAAGLSFPDRKSEITYVPFVRYVASRASVESSVFWKKPRPILWTDCAQFFLGSVYYP
jgi:hypothetical protein